MVKSNVKPKREGVREKLMSKIEKILRDYSSAATMLIESEWGKYDDDDGFAQSDFDVKIAESVATAAIYAWGQKAWIVEYGKGSLMERDPKVNPFLEDYINGRIKDDDGMEYFNMERRQRGLAILGRPYGEYLDLDNYLHFSSGLKRGVNLEDSDPSTGVYLPKRPKLVIRKILFGENGQGGIIQAIDKAVLGAVKDVIVAAANVAMPKSITIVKE